MHGNNYQICIHNKYTTGFSLLLLLHLQDCHHKSEDVYVQGWQQCSLIAPVIVPQHRTKQYSNFEDNTSLRNFLTWTILMRFPPFNLITSVP